MRIVPAVVKTLCVCVCAVCFWFSFIGIDLPFMHPPFCHWKVVCCDLGIFMESKDSLSSANVPNIVLEVVVMSTVKRRRKIDPNTLPWRTTAVIGWGWEVSSPNFTWKIYHKNMTSVEGNCSRKFVIHNSIRSWNYQHLYTCRHEYT